MDNGSSHRGAALSVRRLQAAFHNVVPVHGPVHASWLNQIEIYFSIVQRKVLTPNDFASLAEVEDRLLRFQEHYEAASPRPSSGSSPAPTLMPSSNGSTPIKQQIHYVARLDPNTLPNL